MVEAQGKGLIEQKVELEASAQSRQQELSSLRQEVTRLKERLKEQGKSSAETDESAGPPSPAQVHMDVEMPITKCATFKSVILLEWIDESKSGKR